MKRANCLLFFIIIMLLSLVGCKRVVNSTVFKQDIVDTSADNVDDMGMGQEDPNTSSEEPSNDPTINPTIEPTIEPTIVPVQTEEPAKDIVLTFGGDILFHDGAFIMKHYDEENRGIYGGMSESLVKEMVDADITMVNNEFPYSTRGQKAKDKDFTFRANPKRAEILQQMGVDIVSLANNHILDYGQDALADTFTTLDDVGIDYVGAGSNLDRAKQPIYYEIGDKKIAYIAASKVVFHENWVATNKRPGMLTTWNQDLLKQVIEEAAGESDYVIIYLHWGVEYNSYPEEYQREWAKSYIDAGADVVIGCHTHCLQGVEYYKGKPIVYSLGNFWFSAKEQDTALYKIVIKPDGTSKHYMLPCKAKGSETHLLEKEKEKEDFLARLEKISFSVSFDSSGEMTDISNQ